MQLINYSNLTKMECFYSVEEELKSLLNFVCSELNINRLNVTKKGRDYNLVKARAIYSVIAFDVIIEDKTIIGRVINRSRCSIIHYCNNLESQFAKDIKRIKDKYIKFEKADKNSNLELLVLDLENKINQSQILLNNLKKIILPKY